MIDWYFYFDYWVCVFRWNDNNNDRHFHFHRTQYWIMLTYIYLYTYIHLHICISEQYVFICIFDIWIQKIVFRPTEGNWSHCAFMHLFSVRQGSRDWLSGIIILQISWLTFPKIMCMVYSVHIRMVYLHIRVVYMEKEIRQHPLCWPVVLW